MLSLEVNTKDEDSLLRQENTYKIRRRLRGLVREGLAEEVEDPCGGRNVREREIWVL